MKKTRRKRKKEKNGEEKNERTLMGSERSERKERKDKDKEKVKERKEKEKEKESGKEEKKEKGGKESKKGGLFSFVHKSHPKEAKKPLVAQPGLCGLGNLGNTCFMNSALQCLSNTPRLNKYFSSGKYKGDINKRNPIGMKGQLADAFGDLMKCMWSGEYKTLAPRTFKKTLGRWAPQFSGYSQNDSQELLSFLLDGLHEDTNKVSKKPIVEPVEGDGKTPDSVIAKRSWKAHLMRNQSLIVDLFQGQLKSVVTCSKCHYQSVKFDPFMFLSLPLPKESTKPIEAVVIRYKGSARHLPVRYAVNAPRYGNVEDVKKLLSPLCGVPEANLVLAYLGDGNRVIQRFISSTTSLSSLMSKDVLFFFELPVINKAPKEAHKDGKHKKHSEKATYRVCFVHRTESSKKKGNFRLKGLPFVVDFEEGDTCNKLYEAVWKRYKFLFGKAAKEPPFSTYEGYERDEQDMHDSHARSSNKKREYPFVISIVSYTGTSCGVCKSGCSGCQVMCKKKPIYWEDCVRYGKVACMSVDWCVDCAKRLGVDFGQLGCVAVHDSCLEVRESLNKAISLDDCMRLFSAEEHLGKDDLWYCPRCKKHRLASKKMDIWKLPEILVVHLKRFQYTATRREKLNVNVGFRTKWNLKPFVLEGSEDGSGMEYEMYAGSYHMGGLGGGHYIAYAKNGDDNNWYCFNDSQCTKANESEIHSNAAYVLFYRRVDKHKKVKSEEESEEKHKKDKKSKKTGNFKPKGDPKVSDSSEEESEEEKVNPKSKGDPKVSDSSEEESEEEKVNPKSKRGHKVSDSSEEESDSK